MVFLSFDKRRVGISPRVRVFLEFNGNTKSILKSCRLLRGSMFRFKKRRGGIPLRKNNRFFLPVCGGIQKRPNQTRIVSLPPKTRARKLSRRGHQVGGFLQGGGVSSRFTENDPDGIQSIKTIVNAFAQRQSEPGQRRRKLSLDSRDSFFFGPYHIASHQLLDVVHVPPLSVAVVLMTGNPALFFF